jgi:hypothetical protein
MDKHSTRLTPTAWSCSCGRSGSHLSLAAYAAFEACPGAIAEARELLERDMV